MNRYIHYGARVTQVFIGCEGAPPGGNFIDDERLFSVEDVYVDDGVLLKIPFRPSPHHVFDYAAKQWIDPRTPETEWPLVRAERDRRLAATDWTQLPDVPLATKEAWAAYRQALRDITEQPDPLNIVWPEPPAVLNQQ